MKRENTFVIVTGTTPRFYRSLGSTKSSLSFKPEGNPLDLSSGVLLCISQFQYKVPFQLTLIFKFLAQRIIPPLVGGRFHVPQVD